jgi:hypothetical protein
MGTPNLSRITSPSISEDPENMRLRAMAARASATPRSAGAQFDAAAIAGNAVIGEMAAEGSTPSTTVQIG